MWDSRAANPISGSESDLRPCIFPTVFPHGCADLFIVMDSVCGQIVRVMDSVDRVVFGSFWVKMGGPTYPVKSHFLSHIWAVGYVG